MPSMNELCRAGRDAVNRRRHGQTPLSAHVATAQPTVPVHDLVPQLRSAYRNGGPDDDPLHHALFIAAGLRAAGVDAALVVGRETAPPSRAARYLSWVETPSEGVVTTGAPVEELYEVILRIPHDPSS